MTNEDRLQIAADVAGKLRAFAADAPKTPVLVGFDGFVDSIIRVVDKRHDLDRFDEVPTIKAFGDKILAADGKSANFEFVVRQEKLGGNGPIMANALLEATLEVAYIGALGLPNIHPSFTDFAGRAEAYPVCDPGFTDAVEFGNGKLMFGKYAHMAGLDAAMVENEIGTETLTKLASRSRLIGMTNWTMLPNVESVWRRVTELIPEYADETMRPIVFVDFADPAKRTDDDLRGALTLLSEMQSKANVVLGLNLSESNQVRNVLGMKTFGDDPGDEQARAAIEDTASAIRAKLGLTGCVVHPREAAAACLKRGDVETVGRFAGPYVAVPKLSTGAGDNFNAGFCLGLLAGLDVEGALCTGVSTSGFYVRNARSPKLTELADFCDQLPPPEVV